MKQPSSPRSVVTFALLAFACACSDGSSKDSSSDAGGADGSTPDASASDASPADGATAPDATADANSAPDASAPDGGGELTTCDPSKAPDVGGVKLETVIDNVDRLVFAAQPKGSSDWYLVSQKGLVMVSVGGAAPETYLDVRSEIALLNDNDERGLLSIAFAPDFATSKIFFVMLSPTTGADGGSDVVRKYQHQTGSMNMLVDTLVKVPASAGNHNGGTIEFGPDGFLYVGTGDGGQGCNDDQPGAPQKVDNLFGKILRLDVNNKAGNYAAPGNPFTEETRVLHYGLRNPFRFHVDRVTGDLYVADVGQAAYEEVSFAKSNATGLNFGWPAFEANTAGNTLAPCVGAAKPLRAGSQHTAPFFVADRRSAPNPACTDNDKWFCDWVSVVGGFVYRGNAAPKLKGAYVFGDYFGKRMVAVYRCESGTSPLTVIRKTREASEPNTPYFADSGAFTRLTAIVEDNAGEMYFVVDRSSLRKVVAR